MNEQDKDLLLTDLCARLPYGVKCQFEDTMRITDGESDLFYDYVLYPRHFELFINHANFYIKPYLRSMSSMTIGEREYLAENGMNHYITANGIIVSDINFFDWLNAHHFDFRGLIEKELALKAPEGMYNTKIE